ncbi:hypothetical protein [Neobacillus ginsengisoli]|uniref:Uncharacterized protein n=1 Tax=Neobacillus ginsengisoli TaxID=904295 RepID=A0ABT9XQI3_9BACI|nr:hypothetical protein [Neobacillus ginsengisoli]MDQ0197611.1 hypothetical protein [Neobacillus ginsengisoli]
MIIASDLDRTLILSVIQEELLIILEREGIFFDGQLKQAENLFFYYILNNLPPASEKIAITELRGTPLNLFAGSRERKRLQVPVIRTWTWIFSTTVDIDMCQSTENFQACPKIQAFP